MSYTTQFQCKHIDEDSSVISYCIVMPAQHTVCSICDLPFGQDTLTITLASNDEGLDANAFNNEF